MTDAKPTDTDIANAARELRRRHLKIIELDAAVEQAKADYANQQTRLAALMSADDAGGVS